MNSLIFEVERATWGNQVWSLVTITKGGILQHSRLLQEDIEPGHYTERNAPKTLLKIDQVMVS